MQALQLPKSTQAWGLTADGTTYSGFISACEKGPQWEQARELVGAMPARGITHCELISACEKGRHWEQALHLFGFHCKMISACEKGKQLERVVNFHSPWPLTASPLCSE